VVSSYAYLSMAKRSSTRNPRLCCSLLLLATAACNTSGAEDAKAETTVSVWEQPAAEPELEKGRRIWLDNCKRCHAYGIEDAPVIGNKTAWNGRVTKAVAELTQSVISGRESPAGGQMPPRAGNDKLTDQEIERAVRFMVSRSR
jgi:cytochrome c5